MTAAENVWKWKTVSTESTSSSRSDRVITKGSMAMDERLMSKAQTMRSRPVNMLEDTLSVRGVVFSQVIPPFFFFSDRLCISTKCSSGQLVCEPRFDHGTSRIRSTVLPM